MLNPGFALRLVLAVGCGLVSSALAAQNLILNPDFTSGVSTNWTASATCPNNPGTCTVASDTTNGCLTTPSARLTARDAPGQSLTSGCYAVTPGSTVDLGIFQRANAADANSEPQVFFTFYGGAGASGCDLSAPSTTFEGAATITNVGAPVCGGTWQRRGQNGFLVPLTATHFNASVQVRESGAAPAFTADFSFDRAHLGPPGTLPVELLHFEVEGD